MEYNALFSIDSEESNFEYVPSRLIARAIDYTRFGQRLCSMKEIGMVMRLFQIIGP